MEIFFKDIKYLPDSGEFFNLKTNRLIGHVSKRKNGKEYISIFCKGKRFYAHRVAWFLVYGNFPTGDIDHINGDGTDNRIKNLRTVSKLENQRNCSISRNNKSGVTGVSWDTKRKKWWSVIGINYKRKHLGYFENFNDAVTARKLAERMFGFHINHGSERKY